LINHNSFHKSQQLRCPLQFSSIDRESWQTFDFPQYNSQNIIPSIIPMITTQNYLDSIILLYNSRKEYPLGYYQFFLELMEGSITSLTPTESNLLECTIRELEKDCDTLEEEANRLLIINRDIRTTINGTGSILDDFSATNEESFAAEIDATIERHGPEGQEVDDLSKEAVKISRRKSISELSERERPRYTLYELEEVLNEKNKFKGKLNTVELFLCYTPNLISFSLREWASIIGLFFTHFQVKFLRNLASEIIIFFQIRRTTLKEVAGTIQSI
jgi:hypothetical protein